MVGSEGMGRPGFLGADEMVLLLLREARDLCDNLIVPGMRPSILFKDLDFCLFVFIIPDFCKKLFCCSLDASL